MASLPKGIKFDLICGQKELVGKPDALQDPDIKTPEGRIAMAREVLAMIERNLNAMDAEGRTVTTAGLSPVIYAEAMAVVQEPGQSVRIATLDLQKTPGMEPRSAWLLRGRYIVGILTFGRD